MPTVTPPADHTTNIIDMSDSPELTIENIIAQVLARFSGSRDGNTLTDEALLAAIDKHCAELGASDGEKLIKDGKLDELLQKTDPGQKFRPDVEEVCIPVNDALI
jgi:hypothetical protein